MVTLVPVLKELGYRTASQQLAMVKLLHAAGAYGEVPEAGAVLTDGQADAVLKHVQFNSASQAADWLLEATQKTMLRTPGKERFESVDNAKLEAVRDQLEPLLKEVGLTEARRPQKSQYDHVLVLGAMQEAADNRIEVVRQMWQEGVRFDKIALLGSERPLVADREPAAATVPTEHAMMEKLFIEKSAQWPDDLKQVPVNSIDVMMKADGTRPNTYDTVAAWRDTKPKTGNVLVISNQPYVDYQAEAVKAALPDGYKVEAVGAPVDEKTMRMNVAFDALARKIHVGFDKLRARLANREKEQELSTGELVMMRPADIEADHKTYQFRRNIDETGITHNYRDEVKQWDPILNNDPLLVHQRKDGHYFVADGHHRLDLAKRLNAEGKGPTKVAVQVLREEDGYSAQDAKIIAAFKNLAHGHADLLEAAQVLRESREPGVHREKLPQLPMGKGNLRDAEALSHLCDEGMKMVESGDIPAVSAAVIAHRVKDPIRQLAVLDIVRDKLAQQEIAEAQEQPPVPDGTQISAHASHEQHGKEGQIDVAVAPVARVREGSIGLEGGREFKFKETTFHDEKPTVAFSARLDQERIARSLSTNHLAI